ncbi:MAG: hypothetical protein ACRDWY_12995 [Actinomycetes bacterium]
MSEFTPLREAVDSLASRTPSPDFGELKRRAARRGRRRVAMVAAATTTAVIVGSAVAVTGLDGDRRTAPPVEQPKPVVGAVPVWYDAKGLHRGDVVEQTPVKLVEPEQVVAPGQVKPQRGALALVRSGAVYLDPATGDVWFHPWGDDPRIVGHNSEAGPGGDPNGDTAAWFEGSDALNAGPRELVVYDTATGREISRTSQSHGVIYASGDHYPAGNGFRQVSAERVVWTSGPKTYSHDVRTQSTSEAKAPKERHLADVHGDVEVFGDGSALVMKAPGRAEERYPELETHVRLSPSGNYVLAVEGTEERHAAAIVDTRTGELWRVPKDVYPWIAWSYGDIAMVDHTEDELLACDAAGRACERLPAERPFLMPTN